MTDKYILTLESDCEPFAVTNLASFWIILLGVLILLLILVAVVIF